MVGIVAKEPAREIYHIVEKANTGRFDLGTSLSEKAMLNAKDVPCDRKKDYPGGIKSFHYIFPFIISGPYKLISEISLIVVNPIKKLTSQYKADFSI